MNGTLQRAGSVGVVTVLCAVVAAGVWIESRAAALDAARQIKVQARLSERTFYTKVCERTNIVKAEARVAAREVKAPPVMVWRRDKLFVILDCQSTFEHGGRGIPLTQDQQQRYMDMIAKGRVPDLRRGQVIGSHEPEQGGLADF